MKHTFYLLLALIFMACTSKDSVVKVMVEAESFSNKGKWVTDQQFMDVMGSPYIMAHGMGVPVGDATTRVSFDETGEYVLWVRTKNWTANFSNGEGAGQFKISVGGKKLPIILGTQLPTWEWVKAGVVDIDKKEVEVSLHDLTGFNGRCDALLFSKDESYTPPNDLQGLASLRKNLLGIGTDVEEAGKFDLVIVGGGMPGICAAISAARLGVKVALIQNRPVLGGNNSSEVRVHLGGRICVEPFPNLGTIVNEIGPKRGGNAKPKANYEDNLKLNAIEAESNITLFLSTHANKVEMEGDRIIAVEAQNIETGKRLRFEGALFADCTGDGTIGALAGAEFMSGRESKSVFNEPTAPERGDSLTMGVSVQWFAKDATSNAPFPQIKWGLPWSEEKAARITRGDWNWETGMGRDMEQDFEEIRDYGMMVVYSNWSYIKNNGAKKSKFENKKLQWVAFVGGKRESRRLTGDLVLTENDLLETKLYTDGTAPTTWTIDLHYPDKNNEKLFPGAPFRSIAKHTTIYPYPIPFRCLYSKNIENLMMGGRNISVSHVALGTVRLMRTGGMMGEVLGMAASVGKKHNALPRDIYSSYFDELKELMEKGVGNVELPNKQTYNMGGTLLGKPRKTK